MVAVNADTQIRLPNGQYIAAALAGPVVNGKVNVNNDTVIRLPNGGTMVAGAIGASSGYDTWFNGPTNPAMTGGTTAGGSQGGGKPADDTSASVAQTDSLLRQLGLQDLIPEVEGLVRSGASPAQIENMLYDPTTTLGKKLDALYPEIQETRKNGLPPINVQNVLDARTYARKVVNQLGVQDAFPGDSLNQKVREYLRDGKDITEFQSRLVALGDFIEAKNYSDPAHQADLAQWETYYGVKPTTGELVSMALNPDFTVAQLQNRAMTAKIGAVSTQTGFGPLALGEAQQIAGEGYNADQARQGLGQLASIQPALGDLTGQQVDVVGRQDQLDSTFGGNANAARRIAKRQREQQGLFAGGGSFANNKDGFAVGSAVSR